MQIEYYDDPEYFENLSGRTYPKVSPKRTHAVVTAAALRVLDSCGAREQGTYGAEWRFRIGAGDGSGDELQPDVSFVSHARLGDLSDEEVELPPFAPDLVIEIRSPGQSLPFMARKRRRYFERGARLVLDIDSKHELVHAVDPSGAMRTFRADDQFEHDALPWLRFEVRSLFEDVKRR